MYTIEQETRRIYRNVEQKKINFFINLSVSYRHRNSPQNKFSQAMVFPIELLPFGIHSPPVVKMKWMQRYQDEAKKKLILVKPTK